LQTLKKRSNNAFGEAGISGKDILFIYQRLNLIPYIDEIAELGNA
jgi:hypothetical protein